MATALLKFISFDVPLTGLIIVRRREFSNRMLLFFLLRLKRIRIFGAEYASHKSSSMYSIKKKKKKTEKSQLKNEFNRFDN